MAARKKRRCLKKRGGRCVRYAKARRPARGRRSRARRGVGHYHDPKNPSREIQPGKYTQRTCTRKNTESVYFMDQQWCRNTHSRGAKSRGRKGLPPWYTSRGLKCVYSRNGDGVPSFAQGQRENRDRRYRTMIKKYNCLSD